MNIAKMMQQAQKMQTKMAEMQETLGSIVMTGEAGGGMVKVQLSGKNELKALQIDPSIIDPSDTEMLEDLIIAAHNDAMLKVQGEIQRQTAAMMEEMGLPPGMAGGLPGGGAGGFM